MRRRRWHERDCRAKRKRFPAGVTVVDGDDARARAVAVRLGVFDKLSSYLSSRSTPSVCMSWGPIDGKGALVVGFTKFGADEDNGWLTVWTENKPSSIRALVAQFAQNFTGFPTIGLIKAPGAN